MRFSLPAVLLSLHLPAALVSAYPSTTYDARFAALTVRHARLAERSGNVDVLAKRAELDTRQGSCTAQCSSGSDQNGIAAYNSCSASSAVCICNALESLSNECLACVLPAIGLSSTQFSEACNGGETTSACDSQCSSASDVAANQAAGECTTASIDDPCVCAALGEMSSTCRSCLLQASGISTTDYTEACGGSSGGGATSAGGSKTSTGTLPTTTGSSGGTGSCTTTCASASDQTALNAGEACAETDDTCQCNALAALSQPCLTCLLTSQGVTVQQYQAACPVNANSVSFTGASSRTSATPTSLSVAPTNTATSGGGSGFNTPSCTSSCTTSADQTAIQQGNACSATDVGCACNAFNAMDSTCRTCILTANGVTAADLTAQCAAVSQTVSPTGSSKSAASPGSSSLPNSQQPTSGAVRWGGVGLKEVMAGGAVALGALIFV